VAYVVLQICVCIRAVMQLIFLIAVLMHILFVITYFNLFVFHLQVDIVGPLLLNASLLYWQLITVTD